MSFKEIIKEAHARVKSQIAIYSKIARLNGKYTYHSLLSDKMKDIYREIKTGSNVIMNFEKHLTYNP